MTDLPKLSIVLVTYKRPAMALRTILSTCRNLEYPPDLTSWYVADDGSPKEDFDLVMGGLKENPGNGPGTMKWPGGNILGSHNQRMRNEGQEDTFFAGKGWNKALGIAHQNSDFVLFLEDDWELEQPFDLVPYVKLLQEREDVGLVSFRILSVGNDVHTVGHDGIHYLQYQRTSQYAYSGNPHLRHARFVQHYGWFAEDVNPGGIELAQDDRYRLDVAGGPAIWRPVTIDPWGAWHHIGNEKSWE